MKEQIMVFSKEWFKKYSNAITFVARLPFIGELIFNFKKFGHYIDRKKIVEVTPNSVIEFIGYKKGKVELKQHFFVRNEYALRLQKVFYPIWIIFHTWDMLIANNFCPQLNLGFDTLTVYPDTGTGRTTVDGLLQRYNSSGESWSSIRSGKGTRADPSASQDNFILMFSDETSNYFRYLNRSIFLFDTSSLTSVATISSSVISLYGTGKTDNLSTSPNIDIYTSTPSTDNNLQNSDFSQIGTTSQTGSPITYASWNTSAYNDFTFNATGIGNISKTGISKFGARNANYDVSGTTPNWISQTSSGIKGYYSDNGSNKPKLVVTYTLPITFIPRTMWFN